jgi:hypothetical protein
VERPPRWPGSWGPDRRSGSIPGVIGRPNCVVKHRHRVDVTPLDRVTARHGSDARVEIVVSRVSRWGKAGERRIGAGVADVGFGGASLLPDGDLAVSVGEDLAVVAGDAEAIASVRRISDDGQLAVVFVRENEAFRQLLLRLVPG